MCAFACARVLSFAETGEYICKVSGVKSEKFESLVLETNLGNVKEFGRKQKQKQNSSLSNFTLEVPRGRRAVAFFGGYAGNLHNIG